MSLASLVHASDSTGSLKRMNRDGWIHAFYPVRRDRGGLLAFLYGPIHSFIVGAEKKMDRSARPFAPKRERAEKWNERSMNNRGPREPGFCHDWASATSGNLRAQHADSRIDLRLGVVEVRTKTQIVAAFAIVAQ